MKKWIQKLKASPMMKNVMQLTSGTLAGQALSFALMPIFARVYGDFVIGEWAFINAIAMVLVFVVDLGIVNAIMLEKSEEAARQTCRVLRSVIFVNCCVVMALAYLYFALLSPTSLSLPPLFSAGYLAFSVFCIQDVAIYYTYLIRAEQFSTLMKNPLIQNIAFGAAAIGLSFLGVVRFGYFIGWGLGQLAQLLHMGMKHPDNRFALRPRDFKQVFSRNKHYIKMQMPANIITEAKTNILPVMLKMFFGTAALGQFSITMRIIQIPANLIGTAIGRVFFSAASKLDREGKSIGEFARDSIAKSMKVAAVPVAAILAFADIAMNWFLGPGWEMAGTFTRILAVQAFFLLLVFSTQGIYIVLKKQKYVIVTGVVQCAATVLTIAAGAFLFHDVYTGMLVYIVMFVVTQTAFFCALFRVMKIPAAAFLRSVSLILLIALGAAFLLRAPLVLLGIAPGW